MSRHISGRTGLICLLGSPVAHSISPEMHNAAFELLDLDYAYLAFDVKPAGLEAAVEGLRKLGVRGFNLTMPDKNDMAKLCDELSPAARICGAVNTVVNEGGKLTGHTTDGAGWIRSARAAGCDPAGKRIVQLGAGGAGTAILVQAALDGAEAIDVFNMRDPFWPRVEEIVDELNRTTRCAVALHELTDQDALRALAGRADVLLNTTPVGMKKIPGCLIPDPGFFHEGLTVSDVIYEPKETELLRMARQAGLRAFNGMYMLLYQGAASFELWTGKRMPVDEIKRRFFDART